MKVGVRMTKPSNDLARVERRWRRLHLLRTQRRTPWTRWVWVFLLMVASAAATWLFLTQGF